MLRRINEIHAERNPTASQTITHDERDAEKRAAEISSFGEGELRGQMDGLTAEFSITLRKKTSLTYIIVNVMDVI